MTTTSLGYNPKPLYMPQTTRTFSHFWLLLIRVDKNNGHAAPPLQQRWGLMLYATVSNDSS